MGPERDALWEAAFAKQSRGEEIPTEDHEALLPPDLFEGLDEIEIYEEGCNVVRYRLHGWDLSAIQPRGPAQGAGWFNIATTFGEDWAKESLRRHIEASSYDIDSYVALETIEGRMIAERLPIPDELRAWRAEVDGGARRRPPGHRGHKGRPRYANDARNFAIAELNILLEFLGLKTKTDRMSVIAKCLVEMGIIAKSEDPEELVRKALEAARKQSGRLPLPWGLWPHPREPKKE